MLQLNSLSNRDTVIGLILYFFHLNHSRKKSPEFQVQRQGITEIIHCACRAVWSLVELCAGAVVKPVVSCQSTCAAFSFHPVFSALCCHYDRSTSSSKKKKKKKKSLQSRASRWPHCTPVRNANTYSVLTCKCLQTHKHTHSSSQQAACSVWVSYCTGCLTHRRQTVLLIGAELGSQTLTYWTDWPECSPGQPQIAGPCQPFIRLSKAPLYVAPLWRSCCSSELVLCSGKKIPRRCWGDESFFKALGVRGNSTTD